MAARTMQLPWSESAEQESLATCLRAVLARFDDPRPTTELVTALGLGAAVVAVPSDELAAWGTYARDARLVETAELYGLRLRPLHPADAARGLKGAPEFRQHYLDSYVPLIVAALEHGQSVLAWQGWPAPSERLWGVITHREDRRLRGHAPGFDGEAVDLAGPALQVYVVEGHDPPRAGLTAGRLLAHAAGLMREMWNGTWAADPEWLSGRAAYEAWKAALHQPRAGVRTARPLHEQHSRAAGDVAAARGQLARWLREAARGLEPHQRGVAQRWAEVCQRVEHRMRLFASPRTVRTLFDEADGIERICGILDDVSRTEAEMSAALERVT